MDIAEAMRMLRETPLAEPFKRLGPDLVEPCLAIETKAISLDDLAIGASRFGGVPDVPVGFVWPQWNAPPPVKARDPFTREEVWVGKGGQRHLQFVAQIDLSNLPESPVCDELPAHGFLSFFCDPHNFFGTHKGVGAWRALYHDVPRSGLQRVVAPPHNPEGESFRASALSFTPAISVWRFVPGVRYGEDYSAFRQVIDEIEGTSGVKDRHRLGGAAVDIQGDVRWAGVHGIEQMTPEHRKQMSPEARWTKLSKNHEDWRLLLQVNEDDNVGFWWGDLGSLFFIIHKDDLAGRRFDRVWCVEEGH